MSLQEEINFQGLEDYVDKNLTYEQFEILLNILVNNNAEKNLVWFLKSSLQYEHKNVNEAVVEKLIKIENEKYSEDLIDTSVSEKIIETSDTFDGEQAKIVDDLLFFGGYTVSRVMKCHKLKIIECCMLIIFKGTIKDNVDIKNFIMWYIDNVLIKSNSKSANKR